MLISKPAVFTEMSYYVLGDKLLVLAIDCEVSTQYSGCPDALAVVQMPWPIVQMPWQLVQDLCLIFMGVSGVSKLYIPILEGSSNAANVW